MTLQETSGHGSFRSSDRPQILETTTLGAAYLAGLQVGVYPAPDEFEKSRHLKTRFTPTMDDQLRAEKYAGWQEAVNRTLSSRTPPC